MTARIGNTIRANLVEVTEAWSSNAPCRSSLVGASETMATHFARLPRLLTEAASAAMFLNRSTRPAILPTLRPPSAQSRVSAWTSQLSGGPSRSNLKSDFRARSKLVTNAAPFVNGDASPDPL